MNASVPVIHRANLIKNQLSLSGTLTVCTCHVMRIIREYRSMESRPGRDKGTSGRGKDSRSPQAISPRGQLVCSRACSQRWFFLWCKSKALLSGWLHPVISWETEIDVGWVKIIIFESTPQFLFRHTIQLSAYRLRNDIALGPCSERRQFFVSLTMLITGLLLLVDLDKLILS